jgi:hypothetical protein
MIGVDSILMVFGRRKLTSFGFLVNLEAGPVTFFYVLEKDWKFNNSLL